MTKISKKHAYLISTKGRRVENCLPVAQQFDLLMT